MFKKDTSSQPSEMKFLPWYLKGVNTLQFKFHLTGPTRSIVFLCLNIFPPDCQTGVTSLSLSYLPLFSLFIMYIYIFSAALRSE